MLRQRLKAAGSTLSPERALRTLRQIQRHTVRIGGRDFEGVTKPSPEQLELFKDVGIEVPKRPA